MSQTFTDFSAATIERFFASAAQQLELAAQHDRHHAARFNVFTLIRPDENRLSDVLELLLNPRGAHGQRDLFLRLLIERLATGLSTRHANHAKVRREAFTHRIDDDRRRIDLLVDATTDLLAIENKVIPQEQEKQIEDYLQHLDRLACDRSAAYTLIYLTPDGSRPTSIDFCTADLEKANNHLRWWSYKRDLSSWLVACRDACEAPRFRDFLSDFISYIDLNFKCDPEQGSDANQ